MLAAGTKLGPYEVVGSLGAGGMGEVYRAKDSKLKREVALKVLPANVANDRERLARFQREAEVLASLNHPHIAHIHGLEESDGTIALVMELVDGEDLSQRIARGPIPLDEALPIAKQIAEALAAAHEQGIIHRDLKPANIKVREDGTVKVLDFGLAKAIEGSGAPGGSGRSGDAALVNAPTITTPAMTMGGMILGTAAYMAPEQAKGKSVDKRADIWAFGCVLYEMLTGRRAFEGEDVSETLAAVLRSEPDWSALPSDTGPAVIALIKRSLERDTRRRVADISTARFVLDDHALLSSAGSVAPRLDATQLQSGIDIAVARAKQRVMMRRVVPVSAALVIVLAIAGVAVSRLAAPRPPAPVTKFIISLPEGQVLSIVRPVLAFSPDGSQIAYVANGQLYLRRLSEFQPGAIPAKDLGQIITSPAFSPDGEWLAFHVARESLVKKVSIRGGPAVRVCEVPPPLSLTWDPTGILMALGTQGIVRCNASGGTPEQLVRIEQGDQAAGASLLPGGDALLFGVAKIADGATRWDKAQIVTQSLRTGARKTIISGGFDARFTATGHLLYTFAGILFAVPFDPAIQEVRGDPVPVIEGIRANGGSSHVAISNAGVVAYMPGLTGTNSVRTIGIADRTGSVTRLPVPEGQYEHVRVSRDGTAVAIGADDGTQAIIWIYRLGGSAAMQRLTIEGNNRFPIWSPDGAYVAFQSDRGGESGIYRQRADGTGVVERLTSATAGEIHIPESWSPDGRHISFAVRKVDNNLPTYSLWTLTLTTRHAESFAALRSQQPFDSTFSPDGKWLAYTAAPTAALQAPDRGVFVRPFPASGSVYQAPRQIVDFHPVWSRDGRELIYVTSATAGQMTAVTVNARAGISFGGPVRFPARVTGDRISEQPRAFDILPDGRFIGIASVGDEQNRNLLTEMRVVLNWFEDLNARVPVK